MAYQILILTNPQVKGEGGQQTKSVIIGIRQDNGTWYKIPVGGIPMSTTLAQLKNYLNNRDAELYSAAAGKGDVMVLERDLSMERFFVAYDAVTRARLNQLRQAAGLPNLTAADTYNAMLNWLDTN